VRDSGGASGLPWLLCSFRDLQYGRDLVSGTVNVTDWLHVAHSGKTS
jgi:hypothetical protein